MVFNSLGSNYNFDFVLKSLFASNSVEQTGKLKSFLGKKYGGESVLLYKSREAIKLALEISGLPKGSKVGVNGFTCFVVNQAITEAGFTPVYLDIGEVDLNFDINNLKQHPDIKALIIQNTFGCPVDIVSVKAFCNKNTILLIEDLAHSAGGRYQNGTEIGCAGDFTALSFSQDKIVDAVSGGALIIRTKKYVSDLDRVEYSRVPSVNQIRDRLYPLLTFKIRTLYPVGLGKALHFLIKKLRLLSDPMGTIAKIHYHSLPNWYACMALSSLEKLDSQIKHRREIAKIYIEKINKDLLSAGVVKNCDVSTNIRFPIFIENRIGLINYLKNHGIFVFDIWYDAPIAPMKLLNRTKYKGECPKAEIDAKQILNLPTHINVTRKDAERISAITNEWLSTRQD